MFLKHDIWSYYDMSLVKLRNFGISFIFNILDIFSFDLERIRKEGIVISLYVNIQLMSKYIFILVMSTTIVTKISYSQTKKEEFKLVNFKTEDGGTIEASLFEGGKDLGVIFAHGAIFNKESWYFLCEKLQAKGVSSLSIDFRGYGNSKKGSSNNMSFDI